MATEEEILRLVFEYVGEERAKALEADLGRQMSLSRELIAEADRLADAKQAEARVMADAAEKEIDAALDAAEAQGKANNRIFAETLHLGDAMEKGATKNREFGRALLESGRVVQDFSQGGIGGILNNIEGLTLALGGGAGLAGIFTVLGVGLALAGPKLLEFAKSLGGTTNEVPKAADALQRMDDQLKANNKELDALKEKTSLSSTELARFNILTAENLELEKARNAERERRKLLEQAGGPSSEEKERASGALKAIDGQRDEVQAALEKAITRENEYAIAAEKARLDRRLEQFDKEGHTPEERDRFLTDQSRQFQDFASFMRDPSKIADRATDLIVDFLQGEKGKSDRVIELLNGQFGATVPGLVNRIQENSPEGKKAKEEKDRQNKLADDLNQQGIDNQVAMEQEQQKQKDEDAKKAKQKRDKLTEDLNKQGQENEFAMQEEQQKEKDRERKEEQKKIADTVGGTYQQQFEAAMAANAASAAAGGPSLPPQVLQARLRAQMVGAMRRRGASEQGANLAANEITEKGNQDLQKRMVAMDGMQLSNTDRLIGIATQLANETIKQQQHIMVQSRQINALGQQVSARARTGRNRGRN